MPDNDSADDLIEILSTIREDPEYQQGVCPNCDEHTLEFNEKHEACEDCGYSCER